MATPLTADQVLTACRAMGLAVREVPGWRERGMWRIDEKGWTPKWITIHHTAGETGSRTVEQYIADIINGDNAVPDKANAVIDRDGTLWLNAAGRANHQLFYSDAGRIACETDAMPLTGSTNLRGSVQNGNEFSYGVEIIAAGSPNAAQRRTAVLWAAAIAKAHGWTGREAIGHGELSYDRDHSDPALDMGAFRSDVMATVKGGTPAPPPAPVPPVQPPKEVIPMGKDNDPHGWYLPVGTKDNAQVKDALGNLYKYRINLNQPAIAGRSLDEPDVRNLGDGQRIGFNIITGKRLIDVRGLDWPTQQWLQWFDRISLDYKNAQPNGLAFDIRVVQFALAKLGLMGDWSWWADAGTYGPRTTAAVNAFYAREKAILGQADGRLGPLGMGLLAFRTGVFTCTTPYRPATQSAAPANPSTGSKYVRPCDARHPLSARFHQRGQYWSLDRRNGLGLHTGEDIAAPYGANIYATIGGKVITNNYDRSYGYKLEILGDDGLVWRYAHTSKRFVGVGQRVNTGQRIGLVGNSGNVAGAHLHLECFPRGSRFGAQLNPNRWP